MISDPSMLAMNATVASGTLLFSGAGELLFWCRLRGVLPLHVANSFRYNNKLNAEKKRVKKRKNTLRGLSSNYVDGVCEGVHAGHVLVNIDGDSDCL